MPQENEAAISAVDATIAGDVFVSVEMSRSKWVIGLHTRLIDKIALHTMACGDVDALLALIDRARAKLAAAVNASAASSSRSPAETGMTLSKPRAGCGCRDGFSSIYTASMNRGRPCAC